MDERAITTLPSGRKGSGRSRPRNGADDEDDDRGRRDRNENGHRAGPAQAREKDQEEGEDSADQDGHEDGQKERKRTRWPLIVLVIFVIIAAIVGAIYWFLTRNQESTDDAYTDGRAIVVAPHVAGYVSLLGVNDNQFVHKGDLLIEIDPRDYVAARDQAAGHAAAAQAQLANARIALAKARTTVPAEFAAAQGRLEEERGRLFQAEREYRRQHAVDRAATSQQSVDAATADLRIAEGHVKEAEAQLREAALVDESVAQVEAQAKQLEGQAAAARGALEQAQNDLGYTRVTAPQDGWITKRNVEIGNYVQAGEQIFAIVAPEVWITANFKETQLARMRPGQRARIHVDAYPGLKLEGHVDSIQLGSGGRFTAFPPENATGNYVKIVQRVPVKIVIEKGLEPGLPLPLGLSVEPTVLLK